MAKSAREAQSIIRDAFSPVIGVVCSKDAEELCRKSCLSFADMVQPFSRLSSEAHIRDASGNAFTLADFRIIVRDATAPIPSSVVGARMLNNAVSQVASETKDRTVSVGCNRVHYGGSTPWYEEYRECFMTIAQPSEHEFLRHHCACVFVVSSAHVEPLECFQRLADGQQQQQLPPTAAASPAAAKQQTKWLSADYLRYFVLLHDVVCGDESRAEAVYQTVKARYGAQACHLLKINSVQPQMNGSGSVGGPGAGEAAGGVMAANPWSSCARRNYLFSEESVSSFDYSDADPDESSTALAADGGSVADYDPLGGSSSSPPGQLPPLHPLVADTTAAIGRSEHRPAIGCGLSLSDQDRLRIFVRELVVRALVPWAERATRALLDQCQSKKGLNRGLFKKWFNTKPSEKPSDVVQYALDSVEMLQRRLADLYFMFQMYDPAYQLYHSLKKDFEVDKAWMYCAGAQEMAALAVFMQGDRTQRQYPTHYMDAAISSYATTCRSEYFAMRATMLNVEALKSKGMWMQASNALLRMCADEASLRSALLLEQAAHCFLAGGISSSAAAGRAALPSARKFSWYLVLAGERFVRAGQKRHALRCLTTALQAHDGSGWTLAQDYVNILCGRLRSSSVDANDHDLAYTHFANTLRESYGQTATQQDVYMREFLGFCQLRDQQQQQAKSADSAALPLLPVPAVCHNDISVLTCRYEGDGILLPQTMDDRVYAASVTWQSLEDECVELCRVQRGVASVVRPGVPCHTRSTNNTVNPSIPVGEVLAVRVRLHNPLLVPLLLSDVRLLWQFHAAAADGGSDVAVHHSHLLDEQASAAFIEEFPISNITLDSGASNYVELEVRLLKLGTLVISGIQYKIGRVTFDKNAMDDVFVRGRKELIVQGRRLHQTKADMLGRRRALDKRLEVVAGQAAAKLKVLFNGFPASMMCGELRRVQVRLENVGTVPLSYVSLACSDPVNVLVAALGSPVATSSVAAPPAPPSGAMLSGSGVAGACCIPLPSGRLEPAHAMDVELWLRGADEEVASVAVSRPVDFVFGYASLDESTTAPTRLRFSRHSFNVTLEKSLNVKVATRSWGTAGAGDSLSKRLLLVDVENRCQSSQERLTEFSVLQAHSYSRQWSASLAHACKETNLHVNHGEVAKLCLKASREPSSAAGSVDSSTKNATPSSAPVADGPPQPLPSLQPSPFDGPEGGAPLVHSKLLPQHEVGPAASGSAATIDRSTAAGLMRQYAVRCRAVAISKSLNAPAGAASAAAVTAAGAAAFAANRDGATNAASLCAAAANASSPECCVLAIFWKACTILATGEMHDAFGIHVVPVMFEAAVACATAAAAAAVVPAPHGTLRTTASSSDVASLANMRQSSVGSDLVSLQQFDAPLPAVSGVPSLPTTSECLVRFQFRHPTCLDADLGKQRLLSVPVALQLENLALEDVDVEVIKRSPADGLPDGVHWAGKLQTKLRLHAREQAELTMLATFAAEGTYSLNTLDVRARTAAGGAGAQLVSQKDVAPALIVVTDVDSAVS